MEKNAYQKCNGGRDDNSEECGKVCIYEECLCVRMAQRIMQ